MRPRYLLVLDESGQRHVRDPRGVRYGFIEGGLIVPAARADQLADRLDAFKDVFAGGTRDELKSHELAAAMGPIGEVADFEHQLAQVALAFDECGALLAGAFLDKARFFDEPDGAVITSNERGELFVNQQLLFGTLALLFGGFLKRNDARGEILHDELSGPAVHDEWYAHLDVLAGQHPAERARIDSVAFVESKSSRLVQLADVAIGVLRTHYEKRVALRNAALEMVRRAERHGVLLNVQPS